MEISVDFTEVFKEQYKAPYSNLPAFVKDYINQARMYCKRQKWFFENCTSLKINWSNWFCFRKALWNKMERQLKLLKAVEMGFDDVETFVPSPGQVWPLTN